MISLGKRRMVGLFQLLAVTLLSGFIAETASAQENFGIIVGSVAVEGTGNTLDGANVFIVGTGLGTQTGQNGTFSIGRVPPGTYEVEFSFLSYATQRIQVTVAAGQRVTVNAELSMDPLMLDEIVVTGYGTARKEELTGSMVSIPAVDLVQIPSTSFQDVIQGSPGVLVTARDGAPGAGFNIRVRGIGSITAGSEPLYVIDGIPLYNDANNIANTQFDNGGRTANTLASINPNDIESLVVLKDAASTAIYGSRGANGVVLITTKGGVAGSPIWASEPKLEFSFQTGFSDFAYNNLLGGLTGPQYHEYYIEARVNDGMSVADAEAQYLNQWPVQEDNNWLDLMTQTGITNQFDLSAQGGSDRFTYFISASVFNQDGIVLESLFDRYSTRVNLTAQLTDKFHLSNNLSLAQTKQTGINDGSAWEAPFYMAVFMPPVLPMFDEEGLYYADHRNVMGANHPVGGLFENDHERETFRVLENLTGTYRFNDRFSVASAWSFDIYNVDDYNFENARFGDGRNSGGAFDEARSDNYTWQSSNTVNFRDVLSNVHNVDAVVGYEANRSDRDRVNVWGEGFAHPELKTGQSAAITEGTTDRSSYTFESVFTRLNYDYDRTYFVSASFRRDGSSRFGPDKRHGNFWAVGVGWTLSNTSFIEDLGFDYLKLRSSYGQVGNAEIGNYEWQGLYGFNRAYDDQPGSAPSQVANNLLTWESQESFNIGFDYAFLDSKITGSIEWYNKNSSDLLLDVPISYTTGFRSVLQNFGDMKNSGLEFSVAAAILRSQDTDLSLNFNLTTQSNEITKLGEAYVDGTKRREEGRDFQEYYLYGWAGVDPATGGPLYYTDETKTTTTGSLNQAVRFYDGKTATPDLLGSFGLSGRYKSFTYSATGTYMMGHYLYESAERFYHGDGRYAPRSTSSWAWENRWQNPGDDAKTHQQIWGGNSGSQPSNSDRYLDQGDYVRLRDVTFGYQFPASIADRIGLSALDAHVKLSNIYTWVKADDLHFDPEQSFNGVYNTGTPNAKTISIGFTVGF